MLGTGVVPWRDDDTSDEPLFRVASEEKFAQFRDAGDTVRIGAK